VTERIFGDVNADSSNAVFQFGDGGKPITISELKGSDRPFGLLSEDQQMFFDEPDESEDAD
jgi:hypothetical protein